MLDEKNAAVAKKDNAEAPKDNAVKSKVKTKDYTVTKTVTLEKVYVPGETITVEVGSDTEKHLLTNQFVNKHGISRPN